MKSKTKNAAGRTGKKRVRSAITGKYVRAQYARENPGTTVAESPARKKPKRPPAGACIISCC